MLQDLVASLISILDDINLPQQGTRAFRLTITCVPPFQLQETRYEKTDPTGFFFKSA